MSKLNVSGCWATPMVTVQMPEPKAHCRALAEVLLGMEALGDRHRNAIRRETQVRVFESRFDLHLQPQPEIRETFAFIHGARASTVAQLSKIPDGLWPRFRFNYHSWFHVTRHGGYQTSHTHPGHSWSGIFCVDPGDPPPEHPDSGRVRFNDPRGPVDMHLDGGTEFLRTPFQSEAVEVTHVPGQLVLFPSWLSHEVRPYFGQRPRIVIAFNAWVVIDGDNTVRG